MILTDYVPPLKALMRRAAELKKPVRYPELHSQLPEGTPRADVYDTLEAACEQLAPYSEAIYSVVLAKKDTGLPADGFFDIFLHHRNDEYKAIAGGTLTLDLTRDQQEQMVALEKARVYAHAAAI